MADEYGFGVKLLQFRLRMARAGEILFRLEVDRGFPVDRPERGFRTRDHANQRNRLKIGTSLAQPLEPSLLELAGDVIRGEFLPPRPRPPAFEPVAGKVGDMRLYAVGRNGWQRFGRK